MLPNVDLRLLGKQVAEDRARKHRRVDMLAVGHHGIARQRVVMLPTRQLANSADRTRDSAQAGAVPLTPDHALMIGRRDLATPLNQRALCVTEPLRFRKRFTVALVDAAGNDHSLLFADLAQRML